MNKFKVGDFCKVIKKSKYCTEDVVGRAYEVIEVLKNKVILYTHPDVEKSKNYCRFGFDEIELVKENKMSELEELVKKANEGFNAAKRIREEFPGKTELSMAGGNYYKYTGEYPGYHIRIIKEQTFEPFYINNTQWKVWKDELGIHVGCQLFNSEALKKALTDLCTQNGTIIICGGEPLRSTRNYIEYSDDHKITWSDAEKILAALEKDGE